MYNTYNTYEIILQNFNLYLKIKKGLFKVIYIKNIFYINVLFI